MISHEHRCIFIHIPKCAGTSIEDALGHFAEYSGRGAQDHRSIRELERPLPPLHVLSSLDNARHLRRRVLARLGRHPSPNPRNALRVSAQQYRAYFKLTFVRNPWARAWSWYENVLRDPQHRRDHGVSEHVSLGDFLARYAGRGMLRPQLDWLRAFDGTLPLDFIGRFESLEEDFARVCAHLGIERTLPHRVAGSGTDYRAAYDARARALVADVYREEIALFAYRFDA